MVISEVRGAVDAADSTGVPDANRTTGEAMKTVATTTVLNRSFEIVREDLHRLYDASCDATAIDRIVDDVIAELSSSAKVTTYLPVLVEREATARIKATSAGAPIARREILFADNRGSGRSQIAAALANHLVGDKIFVRTIGLHPEQGLNPRVVDALQARGVDTSQLEQKPITPRVSHRADVIVLMGIDETPAVPGDRYVKWEVADPSQATNELIGALVDDIEEKLKGLLAEMGIIEA